MIDTIDRTMFPEFSSQNTALLVIDMSLDFLAVGAPFETQEGRQMMPKLIKLIRRCREIELPIIYINHVHHPGAKDMGTLGKRFPTIRQGKALRAGSEGVQIWPEIAPQAGDIVMEKIRQSGFMYTRLEATLKELEVKNILVAGVATGACVECTARDAVARDYSVIVLSDVTSASGLPDLGWGEVDSDTLQRVFLTNFAYHFGKVASTNELLNGPLAITTLKQA
ncbi:MAG TPA: cysteine hydrolase [Gammaproteobacteria bacterium]|nr:MAG: cysteine hydrolase [Gammaproteobacteria bacterium]HIM96855.1 cysteine hydrolase [Gammaproteobacteria bacterium]